MPGLSDPRWPRERGSSAMRFAVYIAIISAAVYGALYGYGTLRVGQIETTLSQRMSDAGRPTPTEPTIEEALIRQRLVTLAREEGAEMRTEDVAVSNGGPSDFLAITLQVRPWHWKWHCKSGDGSREAGGRVFDACRLVGQDGGKGLHERGRFKRMRVAPIKIS